MNISVGRWAYLGGVIISILAGFVDIASSNMILFVLGLIVGFLNIGEGESHAFLTAVLTLLVVGVAGSTVFADGGTLSLILASFVAFATAAALVVALKTVVAAARK